jgi:hypothetical protein
MNLINANIAHNRFSGKNGYIGAGVSLTLFINITSRETGAKYAARLADFLQRI